MFDFETLRLLPDFTDVKRRVEQLVFNHQDHYTLESIAKECEVLFNPGIPGELKFGTVTNAVADMCRLDDMFINSDKHLQLGRMVPNYNIDPLCCLCFDPTCFPVGYFMRSRRARTSDMDRSHHRKVLGLFCQKCIEMYPEEIRGKYKYVSYSNYRVTMED